MKELNKQKIGLTLGLFLGGVHLVWSLLVLLGVAQPLLDFIFWLHMITNPYRVVPFDLLTATLLVIVTFAVGYSTGWILVYLWNKVHKK